MSIVCCIVCFLPLIAAFLIFTFAFKLKITHQLLAILLGLVAVFPISLIQYFLPSLPVLQNSPVLHSLIKSILLYGFVEEVIQMLLLIPIPSKKLTELDYLLLCFIAGLSLGCFESVVYLFDHIQLANSRGAQIIFSQIFIRIFTSDILHMACTGLCGLFLFSCRNKPVKVSVLVIAILLHGIYDFFAGFQNPLKYFAIVVVLLAIIECRIKYVNLQNLCENRLTVFY